jgi:hypothetical protein
MLLAVCQTMAFSSLFHCGLGTQDIGSDSLMMITKSLFRRDGGYLYHNKPCANKGSSGGAVVL